MTRGRTSSLVVQQADRHSPNGEMILICLFISCIRYFLSIYLASPAFGANASKCARASPIQSNPIQSAPSRVCRCLGRQVKPFFNSQPKAEPEPDAAVDVDVDVYVVLMSMADAKCGRELERFSCWFCKCPIWRFFSHSPSRAAFLIRILIKRTNLQPRLRWTQIRWKHSADAFYLMSKFYLLMLFVC